jgi:hypothetical protein
MIVDQKLNRQFVGVYLVEGTQLATTIKPNWFRRIATRLFIGWKWVSIKQLKTKQETLKAARTLLLDNVNEVK